MSEPAGTPDSSGAKIALGASAVAEAITAAVRALTQPAGEGIQATGNLFADVLEGAGTLLGGVPGVGWLARGAGHWAGTVVSAAFDLAATLVRAGFDLVSFAVAGSVRVVAGGVARDRRTLVRGAGDVGSGIAGAVLLVLAKLVALVQSILFLQWGERPLNPFERALLARVFGRSLALRNIRIVEGFAGLFSLDARPFVLGNRIYMKRVSSATSPAVLVHECCHVWQSQHEGTRYATDALWAHATLEDPYRWREELARGHGHWRDFNKEAQAAFVEEVFRKGRRVPPTGTLGEFFDDDPIDAGVAFLSGGTDHTELARTSIRYLRGGHSRRRLRPAPGPAP